MEKTVTATRSTKIITMTEFRRKTALYTYKIQEEGLRLVVTHRGKPVMGMVTLEDMQQIDPRWKDGFFETLEQ